MSIMSVINPSQLIFKQRILEELVWFYFDITRMISVNGVTHMQVKIVVLLHEDCANMSWCCHFKGRSFQVHAMSKLSGVSLPF